jgi:ABC-type glycerol-3-phosphate transport system permease component
LSQRKARSAWLSATFLQIYANSDEVAVLAAICRLVVCTLAAFAFARLNFPGRDTIPSFSRERPA